MAVYIAELHHKRGGMRYNSYSDIMATAGCFSRENLLIASIAWKTIIDTHNPDLIICEHSPNCCLAAFGRVPVIQLGDGFTLPPAHEQYFPPFRSAPPTIDPEMLLENIRFVQKKLRSRLPQTITEPFRTEARLLCTLPEIDHYPFLRRDTLIGPAPNDMLDPIPLSGKHGYFAYLKTAHPAIEDVLRSLSESSYPGEIYIKYLPEEWASRLGRAGIIVHSEPPPIRQIIPRVSAVFHHGGNGLACAALSAGRPQIILPIYQETEFTGEMLVRMGTGRLLSPNDVRSGGIGKQIALVCESNIMIDRAQSIAQDIHNRGPWRFLETCLETCDRILSN